MFVQKSKCSERLRDAVVVGLVAMLGSACGSAPVKQSVALTDGHAIAIEPPNLVAIDAQGTRQVLAPSHAEFCVADSRGKAVWLVEKQTGSQRRQIRVFDLLTPDKPPVTVASGLPRSELWFFEYADGAVNPPDGRPYRTAAVFKIGPTPTITARSACTDKSARLCDGDIEADLARMQAAFAQPVGGVPLIAMIARRGQADRLARPARLIRQSRLSVPTDRCVEPRTCGERHRLDGTHFDVVITAEREVRLRYDQVLISRQFFDPRTRTYFDPWRPGSSQPQPLETPTVPTAGLISPDGWTLLTARGLTHLRTGPLTGAVLPCGFVGPGRILETWPYPGQVETETMAPTRNTRIKVPASGLQPR